MSQWLILERLSHNDLPLPQYATKSSVGSDFAACLTRICKLVRPGNIKEPFLAEKLSRRSFLPTGMEDTDPPVEPELTIMPRETIMVPLGFKCEFGIQYVLHFHVRSSTGLHGFLLANGTGIVDPDYRGELFACMFNRTDEPLTIQHGQRIVQGVLVQCERPVIKESKVSQTERGEGGFGSTGTMIRPDPVG